MAEKLIAEQEEALRQVCDQASVVIAEQCVSPITGKKVSVSVSGFSLQTIENLTELWENPSAPIMVSCIPLEGGDPGDVMLMLSPEKAVQIADMFSGNPRGTTTEVDVYVESMVEEMGKFVMMAYVNALMQKVSSMCTEGLPTKVSGPWPEVQRKIFATYKPDDILIHIGLDFSSESDREKEKQGPLIELISKSSDGSIQQADEESRLVNASLEDFARIMKAGKLAKVSTEDIRKVSEAVAGLATLHPAKIKVATELLRAMGPTAVVPMLNAIRQSPTKIRFSLIEGLVALGEQAIPELEKELGEGDLETLMIVEKVLERIRENANQDPKDKGKKQISASVEEVSQKAGEAHLLIGFQTENMDKIMRALR